ncbi:hypothetical protein HAX54_020553 [Datura stramonium]|uniref:Uncharacterized protein n=1 Tax=Datura stramonium TaxID=4076 RepID=A0ABS8UR97_DATST|nr:hypothetical protein [Datura stramonium]
MAPKVCKGKGLASSSHGSKRERRPNEDVHEDLNMAPPPLRRYGLRWVMEKAGKKWFKEHKESKYSHDMFIDRNCLSLVFPHMVDRMLTLGLGFMFNAPGGCKLNMGHDIEEEETDYKPTYDPRGVDMTKKGTKGYKRVGPRYEDPLDDDVATEDEMERVDSNIESSDDDEKDSEMGKAVISPKDDEE